MTMADLRSSLISSGLENVTTLLQSGNVIFESNASKSALTDILETTIESAFAFHCEVIVRDDDEIASVLANHPFREDQMEDPRLSHVVFFKKTPDASGLDELRIIHEGPEEFTLIGDELFLHYPDGAGRSRLTNKLIEKYLSTPGTARNWNTVLKIFDLMGVR